MALINYHMDGCSPRHEAFRQGHTPVAILANKHDAADRVPTSASAGGGTAHGCLTLENVRVALGVDAMQARANL